MAVCFLLGHRYVPGELWPRLAEAVERHILEFGVRDFVVGHYGEFDAMAAGAVREAKKRHPEVTLTLLLPYYDPRPGAVLEGCDRTFFPPGMEQVPKPFAIPRANRYMLAHCDYLICYDKGYPGNTRTLAEAARRRARQGRLRLTELETAAERDAK